MMKSMVAPAPVFFNTLSSLSLSLSKPYTPNPKFFSSFVHKYYGWGFFLLSSRDSINWLESSGKFNIIRPKLKAQIDDFFF
jgi:hypothetical protein